MKWIQEVNEGFSGGMSMADKITYESGPLQLYFKPIGNKYIPR
jgi:hypothetical protein